MKRGISLLEIIVAVSIIALLGAIATDGFGKFRKTADLNSTGEHVAAILGEARAKTLSSKGADQYGVHFQSDRVISFRGAAYAGSTENVEFVFPATVRASTISLTGGGSDVIFKRLTGETAEDGTVRLELSSDSSKFKTITIKTTGLSVLN